MEKLNIVIAGTGGQGIVLLTRVLGTAAVKAGLKIRVGEIHGVSQRGGSVLSFVRMGNGVYSPTVPLGTGDILIGLEPVEALRSLKYISPQGLMLLNTRSVLPNTVKTGKTVYPSVDDILRVAHKVTSRVIHVDASRLASDMGAAGAQNMMLLGMFAGLGDATIPESKYKEAIQDLVAKRFVRANLQTFDHGKKLATDWLKMNPQT